MNTTTKAEDHKYLTRAEAADYLRITTRTLDRRNIAKARVGGRVLYDRAALDGAVEAAPRGCATSPQGRSRTKPTASPTTPRRRYSRQGAPSSSTAASSSSSWIDEERAALRAS